MIPPPAYKNKNDATEDNNTPQSETNTTETNVGSSSQINEPATTTATNTNAANGAV